MDPKLSICLCAIKGEPTYQVTIEEHGQACELP